MGEDWDLHENISYYAYKYTCPEVNVCLFFDNESVPPSIKKEKKQNVTSVMMFLTYFCLSSVLLQ